MGWVIHHLFYVALTVTTVATLSFYLPLVIALALSRDDCQNDKSIVCSESWILAALIAACVAWLCLLPLALARGLLHWLVYLSSVVPESSCGDDGDSEWFPIHLQWILQAHSEFRIEERRQEQQAATAALRSTANLANASSEGSSGGGRAAPLRSATTTQVVVDAHRHGGGRTTSPNELGDIDAVRRLSLPQPHRNSNPLSPLASAGKPPQVVMVVTPVQVSASEEFSPPTDVRGSGEPVSHHRSTLVSITNMNSNNTNNNNFVGPASRVTSFSLSRATGTERIDVFEESGVDDEHSADADAAEASNVRFVAVVLILILLFVACQTIVAVGTMSLLAGTLPLFLSPPRVLIRNSFLCALFMILQCAPIIVVLVLSAEAPTAVPAMMSFFSPSSFLAVMLAITPLASFLFAEILPSLYTHAAFLLHRLLTDEDELDICGCCACRVIEWVLQISVMVRGVRDPYTSPSSEHIDILSDPRSHPHLHPSASSQHRLHHHQRHLKVEHQEGSSSPHEHHSLARQTSSPQHSVITSKEAFQVPRMSIFSPSEQQSHVHLRTIHRFETSDTQLSSISTTPKDSSFSHQSDPAHLNRNSPHAGINSTNRVSTVRASIGAQRSLTILFVALRDLVSAVEPEEQMANAPIASTSSANVVGDMLSGNNNNYPGGGGGGTRRLSIAKSLDLTPILPGVSQEHRSRLDQLGALLTDAAQQRQAELLVESDDTFCVVWGLRNPDATHVQDDPIQMAVQLAEWVQQHQPMPSPLESGQLLLSSDQQNTTALITPHAEPRSWNQLDGQQPFHLGFAVVQTRSSSNTMRSIPGAEKRVGEALLSRSCALRSPMVLMDYTATFRSVEWCIARPIGLYVPHTGRPQAMYEVVSRLSENLVGEWHHVLEARERLQLKSKHLTSAFEKVEQGQWEAAIKILKEYLRDGGGSSGVAAGSSSRRHRGSIASQSSPGRGGGGSTSNSNATAAGQSPKPQPFPTTSLSSGSPAQQQQPVTAATNEVLTAKMFLADLIFALQASHE